MGLRRPLAALDDTRGAAAPRRPARGLQRAAQPSAASFARQTLPSTPESGARAGYDRHQRRKGTTLHLAVETLGQLLAPHVTPANAQDRAPVAPLAAAVPEATGEHVELGYVDHGSTGEEAAPAAAGQGSDLQVVTLLAAKQGCVRLPRRWVAERSCAWQTRFRRLVRNYARLGETVAGVHVVAFSCLMLQHAFALLAERSSA